MKLMPIALLALTALACTGSTPEPKERDTAALSKEKAEKKANKAEPTKPEKTAKGPILNPGVRSDPEAEIKLKASQCNDITDGGEVTDGCFSGTITCGSTVIGHTRGGVNLLNTRWYEANYCWPATEPKDGGDERMYKFSFPEKAPYRAKFTLDTPCADLDISVFTWTKDSCPTGKEEGLQECEQRREKGTKREFVEAVTDGKGGGTQDWIVVVEGNGEDEGAFSITTECVNAVHW